MYRRLVQHRITFRRHRWFAGHRRNPDFLLKAQKAVPQYNQSESYRCRTPLQNYPISLLPQSSLPVCGFHLYIYGIPEICRINRKVLASGGAQSLFADKYFSGFLKEYSVAALSFKLMRYFNVSCCADALLQAGQWLKRILIFSFYYFITYSFSEITSPIPRWEAMKEPPTTRLPI